MALCWLSGCTCLLIGGSSSSSSNSKLFSSLPHVLGSGGAHPIAEAPRWAMLPCPALFPQLVVVHLHLHIRCLLLRMPLA